MKQPGYSQSKLKFSVVIPVFNEEGNLQVLYTRLTKVMESLGTYEIIFIDDGSTDSSFQILTDLHKKDKNVKVISFTRNFGQHPAIMAGFHSAQGEAIITLDADLQHPPEEIPKLIEKLDEGCEVVFGVFQQRKHSLYRKAGSAFSKWVLSKIMPVDATYISGFRAMRAQVVNQLSLFGERTKFLSGLLCWMGFKVGIVEVEHHRRRAGESRYRLSKLLDRWFDMIVSFTDIPLKVGTIGGLVAGAIGLLLALFYLIRYLLYGYGVPGFATIVILITVFSGIQLFCLGLIGEYVGRVNREVRKRPDYIIRDKFGLE